MPPFHRDPSACRHRRLLRIGIQESPSEPFRLYLVTCRDCGTTVTTKSLRRYKSSTASPLAG